MRANLGRRNHCCGLVEEVLSGNANQADGPFSFVCTATGDPLGNASLLNRGASNASLEQRKKSELPNVSQSILVIICNGNCGNDINQL